MKKIVLWLIGVVLGAIITFFINRRLSQYVPKLEKYLPHQLSFIRRILNRKWVRIMLILILTLTLLFLIYSLWLDEKLFPDNRFVVLVTTFSHDTTDQEQRRTWWIIKDNISSELEKHRETIRVTFIHNTPKTSEESVKMGEEASADLIIGGKLFILGNSIEIQPKVTWLRRLQEVKSDSLPRSIQVMISDTGSVDLMRRKTAYINDLVLFAYSFFEYRLGRFENAIAILNRLDTLNPRISGMLGNYYSSKSPPDFLAAKKYFERAVLEKKDFYEVYNNWGVLLIKEGNYIEAIAKYHEALKIKPDFAEIYTNLAEPLIKMGEYEKAVEASRRAIEMKADFAEAYFVWGYALSFLSRNEESIELYKKAIKLKPFYLDAYFNWGSLLLQMEMYKEAIKKFQFILSVDDTYIGAYVNWGLALLLLGKNKEAIFMSRKALELDSALSEPLVNWGVALDNLGRHREAIEKYEAALALNPKTSMAYYNWGLTLFELKDYKGSVAKYNKAIELDSFNPPVYYALGITLHEMGLYAHAEGAIKLAITQKPNFTKAKLGLSRTLFSLNRYGEADSIFEQEKFKPADYPGAYLLWGEVLDSLGNIEGAIEKYRIEIRANSGYAEAHKHLGLSLIRIKKIEEGKKELCRARRIFSRQRNKEGVNDINILLEKIKHRH